MVSGISGEILNHRLSSYSFFYHSLFMMILDLFCGLSFFGDSLSPVYGRYPLITLLDYALFSDLFNRFHS